MFANYARSKGAQWIVASAGVKAVKGATIMRPVQYALKPHGIFIPDHLSQPVTKKLINEYRWILTLESAHRDAIIKILPSAADKTFCLRTFGVPEKDIPKWEPGMDKDTNPHDFPDPTFERDEATQHFDKLIDLLKQTIPRVFNELEERIVTYEMGSDY